MGAPGSKTAPKAPKWTKLMEFWHLDQFLAPSKSGQLEIHGAEVGVLINTVRESRPRVSDMSSPNDLGFLWEISVESLWSDPGKTVGSRNVGGTF